MYRRLIDEAHYRLGQWAVRRYERLVERGRHEEAQAWAEGLLKGLTRQHISVPSTRQDGR